MHQRLQLLFNLNWWEKEVQLLGPAVLEVPGGWEHRTEGPRRPTQAVCMLSPTAQQRRSRLWTPDPTHCGLPHIW